MEVKTLVFIFIFSVQVFFTIVLQSLFDKNNQKSITVYVHCYP